MKYLILGVSFSGFYFKFFQLKKFEFFNKVFNVYNNTINSLHKIKFNYYFAYF